MKTKLTLIFLLALCVMSMKSNAQIFYQDLIPDVTINTWNMKDIHIDSLATSNLNYGGAGNLTIWQEFNSQIVVNAFSNCDVLMSNGYPAALNLNQLIPGSPWLQPNYAVLNNGTQGNWIGVTDKYLGVRIKNGIQYFYGWIRMDVNAAGNSVTIKDYACKRMPNASINAGEMPTGINEHSGFADDKVSVYPNPFSSSATLQLQQHIDNASLTIYNAKGNKIKIINNISGNQLKIDRGNLSQGLYFYDLKQDSKNISTGKFIIAD
jgi:hypothetical protein